MGLHRAIEYFLGRLGGFRYNCAQAVAAAFAERAGLAQEKPEKYQHCGGGKAPGGMCGALYAAEDILRRVAPESLGSCRTKFIAATGNVACREIRRLRKATCLECVKLVAAILEEEIPRR